MFRIIKVTGESLSPMIQEGDYVVVVTLPFFLKRIKTGDIIVFDQAVYGKMIKMVASVANDGGEITVVGSHANSVDSRRFGAIPGRAVVGKVIWHIAKPGATR